MSVIGDPAGMRALADRLVKDASQLRSARSKVKSSWKKIDMRGGFADAAGPVLRAHADRFEVAADHLDAAAKALRRSATEVEVAREAERRRAAAAAAEAERIRRELAAQAARRTT